MKLSLTILLIPIFVICFGTGIATSSDEPCHLVRVYNERKDLFEAAMKDMLGLELLKKKQQKLIRAGRKIPQLSDEITKKDDIIDSKLLRVIELTKEQNSIFDKLLKANDEMQKIYCESNDIQQKHNLQKEIDSNFECLKSLSNEIKKRRVSGKTQKIK